MLDFIFATLLFTAYFCFACCLLHNPKDEATTSNPVQVLARANLAVTPVAQPIAQLTEFATSLDDELEEDAKEEPAAAIEEETIEDQETELVIAYVEESTKESQTEPTLEQLLLGIDLDKLQLRPARKIARPSQHRTKSRRQRPTSRIPSRPDQEAAFGAAPGGCASD
jgi:hypothetical protein